MPEKVSNFSLEDPEIFSKSKFKDPGGCESSFFLKKRISQKWRLILQKPMMLFYLRALDSLGASFFLSFTYFSNYRLMLSFQKFFGLHIGN